MQKFNCNDSHVHGKTPNQSVTYAAQQLHSNDVVTIDNCQQHNDYTVDQLSSLCVVTVQRGWQLD